MNGEISDAAIIVNMSRVRMLVPVLLTISYSLSVARARRRRLADRRSCGGVTRRIAVPWFALGFLAVIGFNSFGLLGEATVSFIHSLDTFLLTMAMTALGAETSIEKFKKAGAKPFVLSLLLFVWLVGGGWLLVKYMAPALM